jgi:hypothetical protein
MKNYPVIFEKDHWIYREYGIWPQGFEFVVMSPEGKVIKKYPTMHQAKEAIDKLVDEK